MQLEALSIGFDAPLVNKINLNWVTWIHLEIGDILKIT